ncbi:MAG: N-acetyl-1-D-myo-inositol-2-amino-2-deoxy-alpha-D-glucopyranoside deacetylase [Rhodococcus sp.]|nr:N-acetyl-1-D-myo-inositol-2-amino-2-deoxy-alpha-D-glucopyranoside deacetylase [Rhodococcus sp. (in: high G+C Gram-positive bacteria)]
MLFVHAHPDDESITTGGTIARYALQGADVAVVTCTLGEEGEVIGDRWAGLVAGQADQLGGYRIGELTAALAALGAVRGPQFLGGAGRYRDSGMVGTPSAENPRAFINANNAEAVAALAAVIEELRPHVVVTYNPDGGYGHPDHMAAHRLTHEAVAAASAVWEVPKLYWTVSAASAIADGISQAREALADRIPAGWRLPEPGELASVDDSFVTAEIDVSGVVDRKRAALAAHATQITVGPSGNEFALSNNVIQPLLSTESYVLSGGSLYRDGSVTGERETDLLAGIDLSR